MDITLKQLAAIVAVADHASISAAARSLDLTQPALTHQLRLLEDALAVRLLDRHTRGAVLRPEGQIVVERARQILRAVREIGDGLKDSHHLRGHIRLGIVPTASANYFPRLYRIWRGQYPEVTVEVLEEQSALIGERIRQRDLDLGLVALPLPFADIILEPLWQEELVAVTPPDWDPGSTSIPVTALAEWPFIGLTIGNGLRARVLELFHQASVQPRLAYEATSIATVIGFVEAGLGVSIVPRETAHLHAQAGRIHVRPLKPGATRQLVLAHQPLETLSPQARALTHLLVNYGRHYLGL